MTEGRHARYFDESPAGLRRLVLLLYACVLPPFLALLAVQAHPGERTAALLAVGGLCGAAFAAVALRRSPGPRAWIFPGAVVPTVCCGIGFATTQATAPAFLAILGAPLAWSAVLFEGAAVAAAWVTAVATAFAVLARTHGAAGAAGDALLVAVVYALVAWVVHGKARLHRAARLRALERHLNDAELVLRPDGRIESVNDRAIATYGWTREELVGQTLAVLRAGGEDPALRARVLRELALGGTLFEDLHRRRDGSELPVEVSARSFLQDGEVRTHCLVRDLGPRRAAEADQRFLSALVEHMHEGVITADRQGRVRTWSRGAERLLGWSVAEVLGRDALLLLVPEEERDAVRSAGEAAIALGHATYLGRRRRRDGTAPVVQVSLVPLLDHAGRPDGLLSVIRDVTAEQDAGAALRESEERLVLALGAAETEIWEWDMVRGRLRVGPRWAAMLAVEEASVPAADAAALAAFAHAEDRPLVAAAVQRHAWEGGQALAVEARVPLPSGEVRWVILRGRVVERGASGSPRRMLGTLRDVTERKALEAERQAALDAARTEARRREQMLAVVAHDLRSPLAAVGLTAHALEQVPADPEERRAVAERVAVISVAVERMGRLIEDLLDVAAIQAGRLRVTPAPAEPGAIAREAARLSLPLAERRGVRLEVYDQGAPPEVVCDRGRMVQVLGNLLGNALQATPNGGVVTLRVSAARGEVRFAVVDTGRGLPPGDLETLFEPYRRGESPGYKGAGLGLAIARGVVQGHGGRIWAERPEGGGAAFHVALPARGPSPAA